MREGGRERERYRQRERGIRKQGLRKGERMWKKKRAKAGVTETGTACDCIWWRGGEERGERRRGGGERSRDKRRG